MIFTKEKQLSILLALLFVLLGVVLQDSRTDAATDPINLSVTVADTISLDCGSDVDLGTLTPGTPVSASTSCSVTTNSETGYTLQVQRDDADTTMDKTTDATTNITDKTEWDSTSPNAATYSGTGLGFSVYASTATKNDTWWGTGTSCHDASSDYAGFPAAYDDIMDHTSYSSSATVTDVCYRLDVPSTQESGFYDGGITYQATVNP